MQQRGSKYFAPPPPPPPPLQGWVKRSNSTVSEHGHDVAYQIKWNHKCSNMQAHPVLTHTLDPWGEVKVVCCISN